MKGRSLGFKWWFGYITLPGKKVPELALWRLRMEDFRPVEAIGLTSYDAAKKYAQIHRRFGREFQT